MKPVIAWWSGGITSAAACRIAIDLYGIENVRIVFIDTKNEDPDTYRFLMDCESWYGKEIEIIFNPEYENILLVWLKFLSLNTAHGAICSSELKRAVRKKFQKENEFSHQVFGFEFTKREFNRALGMAINYLESRPIFPLLLKGVDKKDCIEIVQQAGIKVPVKYKEGYENNNCHQTGCVQGGVGYWQLKRKQEPKKFYYMAVIEHLLTDLKGEPVTICKDQSKEAKLKLKQDRLVFLVAHPDYPNNKQLSEMEGREPESLMECNGLCGLDDLQDEQPKNQLQILLQ